MQNRPIVSIIIAIVVSIIGAFALNPWLHFATGFVATLAFQFIIGSAMNQWLQTKVALEMENQLTQRISDAAKQTLKLKCPCTKMAEQIVPIRMDQPNFYKCINCEKNINVELNARTAMMTDVVDIDATHSQVVRTMAENAQQLANEQ